MREFPQANFSGRAYIAPGTQKLRASTGLELQVLMPVVNAPFRLYFAYNPSVFRGYMQPPIAADRSYFPNTATYLNALASIGQPIPSFRKHDGPFLDRPDFLAPWQPEQRCRQGIFWIEYNEFKG